MSNCLRTGRNRSFYLFIRLLLKQTVVIIETYHLCQLHTKFYPTSCCLSKLHIQRKLLGTISVDFDVTRQLLITYSAFDKHLRKWEYNEAEHQLFIDFRKAYDSARREVLCNTLSEFSIYMKLVRLIKMCI
jgi:hypothetical protein